MQLLGVLAEVDPSPPPYRRYGTVMSRPDQSPGSSVNVRAHHPGPAPHDALRPIPTLQDHARAQPGEGKAARRHGLAHVYRSHPAYRHMRDGDRDGVVCE